MKRLRNTSITLCLKALVVLAVALIGFAGCHDKQRGLSDVFEQKDSRGATTDDEGGTGDADSPGDADDADSKSTFVVRAPNTVALDQQFYVEYVLSNAEGEGFTAPDFTDFTLIAGPSVSSSSNVQIINGVASSSSRTAYVFVVQAKQKGTFDIPAATVTVGGKERKTRTLKITVEEATGAGARPQVAPSVSQRPSAPQRGANSDPFVPAPQTGGRDLYFTADVSKSTIYEQEPITLTYRVHASPNIGLKRVIPSQKPELHGFWTQEVDLQRKIDANTGICMQYIMYPQQTGKLTIPSLSFGCELIRQGNFDPLEEFFNGGGNMHQMVQRATEEVEVEVLPLPGKPVGFSGGVGQFSVKSTLLTPQPKTNDVATLRLTVSGTGNLNLVKAPALSFPDDFDSYDAKMTDKTHLSPEGITGEVYFDYTFVPRTVGKYTIPAAHFIYFDTQKRDYVTLNIPATTLDVQKGTRSMEDVEAEVAMRNSDIRDIRRDTPAIIGTDAVSGDATWIGTPLNLGCYLAIIAVLSAVIVALRRRADREADVAGSRHRKARKVANRHLRQAEKALATGDQGAFYAALSQALRGYFADKLGRDAAALTNDAILAALSEKGAEDELTAQAKALLDDCDFARFAPSHDASQRERDLERASELLNRIEPLIK